MLRHYHNSWDMQLNVISPQRLRETAIEGNLQKQDHRGTNSSDGPGDTVNTTTVSASSFLTYRAFHFPWDRRVRSSPIPATHLPTKYQALMTNLCPFCKQKACYTYHYNAVYFVPHDRDRCAKQYCLHSCHREQGLWFPNPSLQSKGCIYRAVLRSSGIT